MSRFPLYNLNSGKCKVCSADTLWGDAPHHEGCELEKVVLRKKPLDLRYTYICAYCGGFAEVSFWSIEVFGSGTALTCDKCSEKTTVLLVKPNEYGCLAAYRSALAFRLRRKHDEP